MFMYWIDPIASFITSWVCCACIGPLLICFLAVMNELASYSYISERSCFKLMNHNPKCKFKKLNWKSLWKAFLIKCSKIFMVKALAFILRSVSLKLLEKFGIDCYAVRRIPENLTENDDFRARSIPWNRRKRRKSRK